MMTERALSRERLNVAMMKLSRISAMAKMMEDQEIHEMAQTGAMACAYLLDQMDKKGAKHVS